MLPMPTMVQLVLLLIPILFIKQQKFTNGGVIHGFSGSEQQALEWIRLGFYIGVGGTITYPRAQKTRTTVARLPLEWVVLETDAPDMPLSGYQGQANSPLQLPLVAQALAQLRQQPLEFIIQQTRTKTHIAF